MPTTRRDFLLAGAAAAVPAALRAANPDTPKNAAVHIGVNDTIRVGLVGCGGRGSGAVGDCLTAGKDGVKLVAIGDVFDGQVKKAAKTFTGQFKNQVDLGDRVFSGLDAYQKVIDSGVDLVMLATPPGFRSYHLEAAVKAGKHVFCEKPVAVDAPGIRRCLDLVEDVNRQKLALVAGTQRRHQAGYIETMKRIQDGEIGTIVSGRCSWNSQSPWFHKRNPGESDVAYQLRNWYHFLWVCGDHIVEQHVHNIDVMNWALGAHPVKAVGFGGRTAGNPTRPQGNLNDVGHIWDHFAIEFEYPNGVNVSSYCAHLPNVQSDVSESLFGSKGTCKLSDGKWAFNRKSIDHTQTISPYVQEHIDMQASIRAGKPLNELKAVTESTMTAILGRTAAYSGQVVKWDDLMKSNLVTMPENLTMETKLEVPPVPVPGKYKF